MPRSSTTVKKLLTQLTKKELLSLAKKKKLRIPEKWQKRKIVDTLSVYFTATELTRMIGRKPKAKTKEAKGYEAQLKAQKLERKVADIFRKKGYKVKVNVRTKGAEFDVIGKKEGGWFSSDEWIFVECKNKPKVIPSDFKKFLGNFRIFCKKRRLDEEEVKGFFYTTGIFDPTVITQARKFPNIKLKRIRNV